MVHSIPACPRDSRHLQGDSSPLGKKRQGHRAPPAQQWLLRHILKGPAPVIWTKLSVGLTEGGPAPPLNLCPWQSRAENSTKPRALLGGVSRWS